jgi:hypothetical protein
LLKPNKEQCLSLGPDKRGVRGDILQYYDSILGGERQKQQQRKRTSSNESKQKPENGVNTTNGDDNE